LLGFAKNAQPNLRPSNMHRAKSSKWRMIRANNEHCATLQDGG